MPVVFVHVSLAGKYSLCKFFRRTAKKKDGSSPPFSFGFGLRDGSSHYRGLSVIVVMIMVMIVISWRLDTRIVRGVGKISRVGRYWHAIGYRSSPRKARLLRIRAE
jgi:hypothetical protein